MNVKRIPVKMAGNVKTLRALICVSVRMVGLANVVGKVSKYRKHVFSFFYLKNSVYDYVQKLRIIDCLMYT